MEAAFNQFNSIDWDKYQNQADLLLREIPSQYELLGKVSEGGMGAIYKARNRYTGTQYAIKVVLPGANENDKALQRFFLEARAASLLKHPQICQVHDFGLTASKMPYLVMEWIEGISLAEKVLRDQRISTQEALKIFQQIASALAHAHQHKVIHRDLKPENIMLSRDLLDRTEIHIVDFGIAKVLSDEESTNPTHGLTQTGMVIGTPLYMSPEQARASSSVDERTDIYSLGCVMHFALTGMPPFIGESAIDTMTMHINEAPPEMDPALKIPVGLKKIILKAMEKDPADRYEKIEQLGIDLKKLSKGVEIKHKPLASQRKTKRAMLKLAFLFVLSFAGAYGVSIAWQSFLDSSLDSSNFHPVKRLTAAKEHRVQRQVPSPVAAE
jgi:eukaryotic-like serine/threonine-protein kinase